MNAINKISCKLSGKLRIYDAASKEGHSFSIYLTLITQLEPLLPFTSSINSIRLGLSLHISSCHRTSPSLPSQG